jgi:superfamily I DNA/RNA helicase
MARLGMDKDFLVDLARLPKPVQARVCEALAEFGHATHTGLHLEKVRNAKDPQLRTIRVDQFWRGVVLAPPSGDQYTLLKVLPHDDAYQWAQRRRTSVNATTGCIELRDVVAIDNSLPALQQAAQKTPRRLFDHVKDIDLRRLGIDEQVLQVARALTHDVQLDAFQGMIPFAQGNVLAGLAAGMTPDDIWSELGAPTEDVDVTDIQSAVERTTERIVMVDGPEELLAVLEHPFDLWRIYLHPAQDRMATGTFGGPARATGGPGTGKTVVALHRARNLAIRHPQDRVLLTTFTRTLTRSLHAALLLLVEDETVRRRIDVTTVDSLAWSVCSREHGSLRILDAAGQRALWEEARREHAEDFSQTFLADEWRQVVLAQRITTAQGYAAASRAGRGRRLGVRQREQVWNAIAAFEAELLRSGGWMYETVCREATRLLEEQEPERSGEDNLIAHAVVDEAQDLAPWQWRFLRALVPSGPDDLFIAGDPHQRIYNHRVSLREVGIAVAGRSARLTVNYRTTAEILAWSLGMLRGERIDDLDGGLESIAGYRSPLHGLPPVLRGHPTRDVELVALAGQVREWVGLSIAPQEIGVAARSRSAVDAAVQALSAAGIEAESLADSGGEVGERVVVGTMHAMKGLEFRCMAVICLNDRAIPSVPAMTPAEEDPVAHAQDLQRERCLLFVACTRAREHLSLSWYGTPSRFLEQNT